VGLSVWLASPSASAQDSLVFEEPSRSGGWNTATTVLTLSAVGLNLLMPRVFYSDPEVTVGWKARFHLSVLAPTMTLAALTLFNEHTLKDSFEGFRPGCDESNQGLPGCEDFGMFSSHALLAFSAFGQGTGIFIVDTTKWSGGRFNVGAFAGNVAVPAVLAVITGLGRSAGDWESAGQVWGSAAVGFGVGLGIGALYAAMQRPECGYTGALLCW
jgi:hypothetical protein